MKKNFIYYIIIWVVLLALFNVAIFVTPPIIEATRFDKAFWISYVFVTLSYIGQLICAIIALNSDRAKKLFLRLPLVTISYASLIVSIIVGLLCMVLPFIPTWIAIIICVPILAFNAVAVTKAYAASEIADLTEEKVKAKSIFIQSLMLDVDSLLCRAQSEETKEQLKKLYDIVRYSDPMSTGALSGVEAQITIHFNSLTEAVIADDIDLIKAISSEMIILLNDRNKKCKLLK